MKLKTSWLDEARNKRLHSVLLEHLFKIEPQVHLYYDDRSQSFKLEVNVIGRRAEGNFKGYDDTLFRNLVLATLMSLLHKMYQAVCTLYVCLCKKF